MPATAPNPGPYDLGPFQEMVALQWGGAATVIGSNSIEVNRTIYIANPSFLACNILLLDPSPDTMLGTGWELQDPANEYSFGTIYTGTFTDNGTGATFRGADFLLDVQCSSATRAIWRGGGSALYGEPPIDGIGYARQFTIERLSSPNRWSVSYWQNVNLTDYNNPPHDGTQFDGPGTFALET